MRSIEEPQSRMPAEQGGTLGFDNNNLGCRSSVPLPLQLPSSNHQVNYDAEYARMESWLDENPEFVQDYFIRKATRNIVDSWSVSCFSGLWVKRLIYFSFFRLVSHAHATPTSASSYGNPNDVTNSPTHANNQQCSSRGGSGATTPVRYEEKVLKFF